MSQRVLAANHFHLGVRLFDTHSRLQPANHRQVGTQRAGLWWDGRVVGWRRHPHVHRWKWKLQVGWKNPDDGVRRARKSRCLTDDFGICSEAPLP